MFDEVILLFKVLSEGLCRPQIIEDIWESQRFQREYHSYINFQKLKSWQY